MHRPQKAIHAHFAALSLALRRHSTAPAPAVHGRPLQGTRLACRRSHRRWHEGGSAQYARAREDSQEEDSNKDEDETKETGKGKIPARSFADMDRRVRQLEELIVSASTTLNEARLLSLHRPSSARRHPSLPTDIATPAAAPLAALAAQCAAYATAVIDAIPRRLKLLLFDLDRAATHPGAHAWRMPSHYVSL